MFSYGYSEVRQNLCSFISCSKHLNSAIILFDHANSDEQTRLTRHGLYITSERGGRVIYGQQSKIQLFLVDLRKSNWYDIENLVQCIKAS